MLCQSSLTLLITTLSVAFYYAADAFYLPAATVRQRTPFISSLASTSDTTSEAIPITVTGNNIQLTPALESYVTSKLEKALGKLSSSRLVNEIACTVHLSVNKNPKVSDAHTAEVVTLVKGSTIRVVETSPDMYSSVDLVVNRLARKLQKYKGRKMKGFHGGPNIGENMANVLNEEELEEESSAEASASEDYIDPYEPVVTKIKSFDLSKPISVKEAIFALDYIDHDFYVFRDEETNEISVVYKRNAGGVGLIQPSQT